VNWYRNARDSSGESLRLPLLHHVRDNSRARSQRFVPTAVAMPSTRSLPRTTPSWCTATQDAAQGRRIAVTDRLDPKKAKRSVTQELCDVMRDAGLSPVPWVSGSSIRLHHALAIVESDGIGAAGRFLGNQS
jgi:hypothetical protein